MTVMGPSVYEGPIMKPEDIGHVAYDAFRGDEDQGEPFGLLSDELKAKWIRSGQAAYNQGLIIGSRNPGFKQYPEIALLSRRPEILAVKEVIAREKLHGSNFRVGFPLGMSNLDEVRFGSREVDYDPTSGVKFPLPKAIEWFKDQEGLLTKMWEALKSYGFNEVVVFGEIFGPGIQTKGVRYAPEGEMKPLFRAFDIMVGDNFLTDDALLEEVIGKMGLTMPPEVWRGPPSIEAFDALLNKPSVTAKANGVDSDTNISEGVVIRANPMMRNAFGDWVMIKHKGTKFSEVAHASKEKKERVEGPADVFAAKYVTHGRVVNALGRLADRGVSLKGTMQDMPTVLAEVLADLHKECQTDWPEGVDDKSMTGSISRILGPIFRAQLTGS